MDAQAANDPFVRPAHDAIAVEEPPIQVPKGHVGPVLLSATGRTVWWTGRVAIGLRYEPPPRAEPTGRYALWVQDLLLKCG
ncbi:MAG: hypothetical protein KF683_07025 [Rubrivivax sp.]|nr:hypothetical protein [Rubrivivax sp.]